MARALLSWKSASSQRYDHLSNRVLLPLDCSSRQPAEDLPLEDQDENDERDRHQYRSGHDVAPWQVVLGIAGEARQGRLHSARALERKRKGEEEFIPGLNERQQTSRDQ